MCACAYSALSQEMGQEVGPERAQGPEPEQVGLVVNLWQDLLINTRLQLERKFNLLPLLQALHGDLHSDVGNDSDASDENAGFWSWVLRVCEIRWRLARGTLCPLRDPLIDPTPDPLREADALLAARLILPASRSPEADLDAFVRLCWRYLPTQPEPWLDAPQSPEASGRPVPGAGVPAGLTRVPETSSSDRAGHSESETLSDPIKPRPESLKLPQAVGNHLEPAAYARLLAASQLSPDGWLARYYAELAWPWLLPELSVRAQDSEPGLFAGTEPWELDRPITDIDWTASLIQSPVVVPGMTTLRRLREPEPEPLRRTLARLDLYLDISGSMPDPAQSCSGLVLNAVILVLSALRLGLQVRTTCFSGQQQLIGTDFTRKRELLLETLVSYAGGATSFPLTLLQQRYAQAMSEPTRILILSDEGWQACLLPTPEGLPGEQVLIQALNAAGGGGGLLLQLLRPQGTPAGLQGLIRAGWRLQALNAEQPQRPALTQPLLQKLLA